MTKYLLDTAAGLIAWTLRTIQHKPSPFEIFELIALLMQPARLRCLLQALPLTPALLLLVAGGLSSLCLFCMKLLTEVLKNLLRVVGAAQEPFAERCDLLGVPLDST